MPGSRNGVAASKLGDMGYWLGDGGWFFGGGGGGRRRNVTFFD